MLAVRSPRSPRHDYYEGIPRLGAAAVDTSYAIVRASFSPNYHPRCGAARRAPRGVSRTSARSRPAGVPGLGHSFNGGFHRALPLANSIAHDTVGTQRALHASTPPPRARVRLPRGDNAHRRAQRRSLPSPLECPTRRRAPFDRISYPLTGLLPLPPATPKCRTACHAATPRCRPTWKTLPPRRTPRCRTTWSRTP